MPKGIYERMVGSLRERFWAKVSVGDPDVCWPWNASHDLKGYGQFGIRHGKMLPAHRVSWEFNIGPIPTGMHVLHSCDNRECVNPKHLRLGTHAENMRDVKIRGRAHRSLGSDHPMHVLVERQIKEIRALVSSGLSRKDVARSYGVSVGTVHGVVSRKTWRHV